MNKILSSRFSVLRSKSGLNPSSSSTTELSLPFAAWTEVQQSRGAAGLACYCAGGVEGVERSPRSTPDDVKAVKCTRDGVEDYGLHPLGRRLKRAGGAEPSMKRFLAAVRCCYASASAGTAAAARRRMRCRSSTASNASRAALNDL
jgi:hypothetical protein